jgi:hypothetical protein
MNKTDGISLAGLAAILAKRITSIKQLHAERGEDPSAEISRQFMVVCDRTKLRSGHVTTSDMEYLSSVLVPEAMARLAV